VGRKTEKQLLVSIHQKKYVVDVQCLSILYLFYRQSVA